MRERIDPFEQMDRMLEQMRHGFWSGDGVPESSQFGARRPNSLSAGSDDVETTTRTDGHALTLDRTDDGFVVLADLPGFEKEEIKLTFEDGALSVSGVHEVTDDHRTRTRTVRESVRVPSVVVADEITASYRNGVLEVTLPIEDDSVEHHRIHIE